MVYVIKRHAKNLGHVSPQNRFTFKEFETTTREIWSIIFLMIRLIYLLDHLTEESERFEWVHGKSRFYIYCFKFATEITSTWKSHPPPNGLFPLRYPWQHWVWASPLKLTHHIGTLLSKHFFQKTSQDHVS